MIQPLDIFVFCLTTSIVGAIALLAKRHQNGRETVPVDPKPPSLLRLRRDSLLREQQASGSVFGRFDQSLERVLIRGGIPIESGTCLLILSCVSLVAAGIVAVFDLPLTLQIVALVAVVFLGLIGIYVYAVVRRNKFTKLFPSSLELLARATRAGANLNDAFQLAARSCDQPVKGEFTHCVEQLRLGLAPQLVVDDLAERIDSVDVHLFSHTLAIHHRLGGKLADSLERLSTIIRDRSECEAKIKSMTSIGRYSVVGIVLMGVFVLIYMLMVEPDYVESLFTASLGQKLLAYAAISELVGLIWVGLALKSDL